MKIMKYRMRLSGGIGGLAFTIAGVITIDRASSWTQASAWDAPRTGFRRSLYKRETKDATRMAGPLASWRIGFMEQKPDNITEYVDRTGFWEHTFLSDLTLNWTRILQNILVQNENNANRELQILWTPHTWSRIHIFQELSLIESQKRTGSDTRDNIPDHIATLMMTKTIGYKSPMVEKVLRNKCEEGYFGEWTYRK